MLLFPKTILTLIPEGYATFLGLETKKNAFHFAKDKIETNGWRWGINPLANCMRLIGMSKG